MSRRSLVVRRVGFAILSMYLIVSVAFGFVALTADPNVAQVEFATALEYRNAPEDVREQKIAEAANAYRASRNLDRPVHERYVDWLVSITTLDWGVSHSKGQPVVALLAAYLPYTVAYVLPAMVLSVLVGVGAGVYSADNRNTLFDRSAVGLAYVGLGLPNFWIAEGILLAYVAHLHWMRDGIAIGDSLLASDTATILVLPTLILSTSLVAGQLHFTRTKSVEVVESDRIKLVRAKGGGFRRVAAHVLRSIAAPLLALFLTELMGVLLVSVFVVETIFGIPGFGTLTFEAVRDRDMPLVLGTTMVVAFVGVGGNLLRDLAHLALDPRVGDEE